MFHKKFLDYWTPEIFIHAPGNEIGLIEHFWPSTVQHERVIPSKGIEMLVSVKHEVSKSPDCEPDTTLSDFANCFRIKLGDQGKYSQYNFNYRIYSC
jgi:hypothetical protein